jgi:hypothetical protein
MAVTLLAAAPGACAPDETPTAPGVAQQVPAGIPAIRSRVEGYATRGELRQGFVLDRAPQLVANGDLTHGTATLVLRGFQSASGDSCINFRGTGTVRVVP